MGLVANANMVGLLDIVERSTIMTKSENKDCISEPSIDDLLRNIIEILLNDLNSLTASKGNFTEQTGILLSILNPRARLSRSEAKGTLFSCLGEFLWYLSGSDDLSFIQYYIPGYDQYSDDGVTLSGAYGPRLLRKLDNGLSQLQTIIKQLRSKNTTRQAVIQIFEMGDSSKKTKDLPCTCTLQFLIRHDRLHMITNMRSNDAYMGLPHDVFSFTMIQELVARSVDKEVGNYKHMVGSLHLYNYDRKKAASFLNEGWLSNINMPEMPKGSPWNSIKTILSLEKKIRTGQRVNTSAIKLDPYWMDIFRLLLIYRRYKDQDKSGIREISKQMVNGIYKPYIDKKCEQLT